MKKNQFDGFSDSDIFFFMEYKCIQEIFFREIDLFDFKCFFCESGIF